MANTYGGYVFLGVSEDKNRNPIVEGIEKPEIVLKELWDALNNPQKISPKIFEEKHVVIGIDEHSHKNIIRIEVPQSNRRQRPVFIKGNPLTGTYRRNFEGDYLCDESIVKQMLSEQLENSRDAKLIEHYDLDDLNSESLNTYRQVFASRQPTHPFNELDDINFLRNIGGWITDR